MEFEEKAKSGLSGIAHISLFHDEFFISSTLDNNNAQLLYSYLVGCSEAIREDRRMKCFTFKEVSDKVHMISQKAEHSHSPENTAQNSDFCRVNNQNSFTFVSKTLHGFIIGPHSFSDSTPAFGGADASAVADTPSM